MAERKIPTEEECKEYAKSVSYDFKPLNEWGSDQIQFIWFEESELMKLIKYCQCYHEKREENTI